MTHHAIKILTRDGQQVSFACKEDETLIAAAEQVSIGLPALCREGGCGACVATCDEGAYRLGEHNPAALPKEAAAQGQVLLCRTYPQSDLNLTAPYDYAHIRFDRAQSRRAEVIEIEPIAYRTVRLTLRFLPDEEGGQAAEFEPGHYMELKIPGTDASRAYSLANTANWEGLLEFIIRLQPGGRFSTLYYEPEYGYLGDARGGKPDAVCHLE